MAGQPKPSTPTGKHKHYNPATKDYLFTQSPLQETEAVGTGQPKPSIGYLRVICTEKNTHTLVRDKPERERDKHNHTPTGKHKHYNPATKQSPLQD